MRVLLYLRVSSEGQARKENPIATQKSAALEYAQKLGHEVDETTDIYVDNGVSGKSTRNRIAFKTMMERVKEDKDVVGIIAYDTSRISRNLRTYLDFKDTLKKHDKKFFSISEPYFNSEGPVAVLMEQVMASFSEFRSGQDGEKIREAMMCKGEGGVYPGKAPYGYKNVRGVDYGGKEKRWIETDPVASAYVKEIFSKYASGKTSLRQLADDLNAKGVPSPNKKLWGVSGIENILRKKTYIGYVDWGGLDNPYGKHEKLIDDAMFYKVQSILRARNYGANKTRRHTFLLRGFSFCDECGSRVNASYHAKKSGKIYALYGCQKNKHSKPVACGQGSVQTKEIEKQLQGLIRTIQLPESSAAKLENKIRTVTAKDKDTNEKMRKSLQTQLDNIEGRRKSLLEKYIDGVLDGDTYKNYKLDLETKEIQLREQLVGVNAVISELVSNIETAIGLARNCYKTYQNAPFDQKVLLAQTFFGWVTIRDKKIKDAFLNHPFAYICREKTRRVSAFQNQLVGGDGRN